MTNVYFIRHAEPNFENHDDLTRELTQKGLNDRLLITDFLSDKNISNAFSSPFKRSIDTIKDFTDKNNLKIKLIENFQERKITNDWITDFKDFSKNQWEDFDYKYSDGESLNEVQKRNIDALNDILYDCDGENIIVGSHGTALSTIINYYNKSFGYEDFENIVSLMPWVVIFSFDGEICKNIEYVNVFQNLNKDQYLD